MDSSVWHRLLTSGSTLEVKHTLSQLESLLSPEDLRSPTHRFYIRRAAAGAASAGNMDVVKYFCEERRVPVNFLPPDEVRFQNSDNYNNTPLLAALRNRNEDMALYLLSLPRGDHSPPLNLDSRLEYKNYPLLTMAADAGMLGVVKLLLAQGVDLLARDEQRHLAVCGAVRQCHVDVVNVLLEAHAAQEDGDGGVEAVLDCPCKQDRVHAYPLLLHAVDRELVHITPEARLAMVRCLVQRWGAKLRFSTAANAIEEVEYHPFFMAAAGSARNVVAFFLDECGIDVNMATPRTKETALHSFTRQQVIVSEREATRMLKYLVEERGADPTLKNARGQDALDMAIATRNSVCIRYFSALARRDSTRVTDPAKLRRLEALERKRAEAKTTAEAAAKATETELTRIREEQEANAKEATAALLAELEAEEQTAAAAAAKKKSKKANKKKGTGGKQAASAAVAALTVGSGLVAEECKAEDKELVPGRALQTEEERQQQEQEEQQQQRQRGTCQEAAPKTAVAAAMGGLSLNEVEMASTPTIATASASAASTKGEDGDQKIPAQGPASAPSRKEDEEGDDVEKDLEEEKHDFFLDGAADGMKCSIGFCLMTEAVVAMDGFSYQKSSLEEYIAHCAAKGQPPTSPLTGEPMGTMFMPNHHVRTFVKDYIGEREKEWKLHVAQQRTGKKGK